MRAVGATQQTTFVRVASMRLCGLRAKLYANFVFYVADAVNAEILYILYIF